jgi:FKBP-type peptidyl-prolyl cis-trans isomerase
MIKKENLFGQTGMAIIIGFVLLLSLVAMIFLSDSSMAKSSNKAEENNLSTESTVKDFEELNVEVISEGDGEAVKAGDMISVHYTGTLIDGSKFDSSVDRGTPFEFEIGAGRVIQGWDQGLLGIKVGSKVILSIPSEMGYGAYGSPPAIPGGAGLVFEVEVLEVK